jgi:thiol-disulfide isomerase/thioredoxin
MTKAVFLLCLYASFSAICFAQDIKTTRIVDERGRNVSSFQCLVHYVEIEKNGDVGMRAYRWHETRKAEGLAEIDIGRLKQDSDNKASGIEMFVTAKGLAPERLACKFEDIPSTIILQKAIAVRLEQRGKTVHGEPLITPVYNGCQFSLYENDWFPSWKPKKIDTNVWLYELKKGQQYLIGWKPTGLFPSKFTGYCSEPFTAQEDGQVVTFEPGLPSILEYDLTQLPDSFKNPSDFPISGILQKISYDGKKEFLSFSEGNIQAKTPQKIRIANLAGGKYYLMVFGNRKQASREHRPYLWDERVITIEPGKVCHFEPTVPVLDTTIEPGDVTIRGIMQDTAQKPLSGERVHLEMEFTEGWRLIAPRVYYAPAITGADGTFEFKGISPDHNIYLYYRDKGCLLLSKDSMQKDAVVSVTLVAGLKTQKIIVGQPLPMARLLWQNGEKGSLEKFKGKILVIDFWATWCGPCLRAMPELNKLAEEIRGEDIRFVTISKDDDVHLWQKKLAEKKWGNLSHAWFDKTANDFMVVTDGIPFCVIADKDGVVRAMGHEELDIKAELQKIQQQ